MTKKDQEEIIQVYKDRAEELKVQLFAEREINQELRSQIKSLQDGLLNLAAPQAYQDLQADKGIPSPEVSDDEKKRIATVREIQESHLNNIEKPLFTSPEDMIDLLSSSLMSEVGETESLHNNSES